MIEINNLVKRHGTRNVVDDISFTAQPGSVTGFLGPNGAGKSSTLRILLGLDKATSGTALINGSAYRGMHNPARTVGAMLDGPGANKGHTAKAHLTWIAQSNGIPLSRISEVLAKTGLSDASRTRIGGFSLGMGQRLGIVSSDYWVIRKSWCSTSQPTGLIPTGSAGYADFYGPWRRMGKQFSFPAI